MERQEKIDRYLKKEMLSEELLQFKRELETDPKLKADVEEVEVGIRLLQTAGVQQVALKNLKEKFAQKEAVPLQRRRTLTFLSGFAASVILALYFSYSPVFLPPVEDDLLIVRSEETPTDQDSVSVYRMLLEGQQAQKEQNYLGAIDKLDRVLETGDLRDYYRQAAQWNLALAYLESGQPRKANQVLVMLDNDDAREYPVSFIDRWKIYLRVKVASFW